MAYLVQVWRDTAAEHGERGRHPLLPMARAAQRAC